MLNSFYNHLKKLGAILNALGEDTSKIEKILTTPLTITIFSPGEENYHEEFVNKTVQRRFQYTPVNMDYTAEEVEYVRFILNQIRDRSGKSRSFSRIRMKEEVARGKYSKYDKEGFYKFVTIASGNPVYVVSHSHFMIETIKELTGVHLHSDYLKKTNAWELNISSGSSPVKVIDNGTPSYEIAMKVRKRYPRFETSTSYEVSSCKF
jgi:hypothetical protein